MSAQRTQHIGRRLIPAQLTIGDHQVVSPDNSFVLDQEANDLTPVLVVRPHGPITMPILVAVSVLDDYEITQAPYAQIFLGTRLLSPSHLLSAFRSADGSVLHTAR